jgi:hypothetical protein
MWDHDPDTASAIMVTPDGGTTDRIVDLKGYGRLVVAAMSSTLTGAGITKLEIVASDSADMSTNLTVVKDSGTVAADAVGDWVVQECTAEELAQLSSDGGISPGLRYAAGRLTVANSADEAVVVYVRCEAVFSYLNLTPATTIA